MSYSRNLPSRYLALIALAFTVFEVRSVSAQTINFNYTGGVVTYTIPTTGTYTLTAAGAQGGSSAPPLEMVEEGLYYKDRLF